MKRRILSYITYFIVFIAITTKINADNIFPIVTPESFGCISDDIKAANDNAKRMQDAINYCIKNGAKLESSANKTYYINKGLQISGFINIDMGCATIVATDSINILNIISTNRVERWNGVIRNFRLDLNNIARCGINCFYASKLHITDGEIVGIGNKAIGVNIEKGYELLIDNIHFHGSAINSRGIKISTSDCHFSDCILINCFIAIDNQGSNFYNRIHAWMLSQYIHGSIFFNNRGGLVFLSQCFSDTYDRTFEIDAESELHLSQLRLYHNKIMWIKPYDNVAPTLFYFKNLDIAEKTKISLIDSKIGNLILNKKNRQKFSNIEKCKVDTLGTSILN